MNTMPKKFEADKIYSTYWWVIKLDPKHPSNYNPNVIEITGYSKNQGHDEAKDIYYLLLSKIIMLHSKGYFDKSLHIDFYKRKGDLLNKSNCIYLFRLSQKDYELSEEVINNKDSMKSITSNGIIDFLTKFYNIIAEGKDVKYLLPKRNPSFSKDEYFNTDNHRFKSKAHLYAFCTKMIVSGHAYDQVMNFQRKYEEKWLL
jgi:hypothetical protein